MKLRKATYGLAIWVVLTAPTGRAQIIAPGGRTVFNRAIMVRSFVEIRRFSLEQDSATAYINPYAAVWGFAPNWNLTAVVPFVALHREFAPGGPGHSSTTSGPGDGLLLLKYDGLYRRNRPAGFTRLAGELGLKLPTGNTTFGSGSTDFVFHLIFVRVSGRHWVGGDAQYILTTDGREGLRAGSAWNYDIFYQYRLRPADFPGRNLFGVLELNSELVNRTRKSNLRLENSGGGNLFLSPGVQFLPTDRIILEVSAPIPLLRRINGAQPRRTTTLLFGLRYLF